jgi:hypothetical protein
MKLHTCGMITCVEKCTVMAKESLIGCYIYLNCNVVVTCYQSATCQHNQTWLLATVFMVCTFYCIDMSILQLTWNYNTIPWFFNVAFYSLIPPISMGQL